MKIGFVDLLDFFAVNLFSKFLIAKINLDGNVDDLERRHRDLVHLFNAQVDSLTPKTKTECVKELMAAETKCAQLESRERSTAKLLGALKEGQVNRSHSIVANSFALHLIIYVLRGTRARLFVYIETSHVPMQTLTSRKWLRFVILDAFIP